MRLIAGDSLQVRLTSAVGVNQLPCVVTYTDTPSTIITPLNAIEVTNDTTPVELIASPASGHIYSIDSINVFNADNEQREVTISIIRSATEYVLYKVWLEPEQTLTWTKSTSWSLGGGYRSQKSFTIHGDATVNWALSNSPLAERFAVNTYRTVFSVDLDGYTQVRLRANQQVTSASAFTPELLFRYHTSYATVYSTYVQLGLSGELSINLTGVGYKDTGWIDLALGARTNNIFIAPIERGGDGVADPAFGAVDILFR